MVWMELVIPSSLLNSSHIFTSLKIYLHVCMSEPRGPKHLLQLIMLAR
jgi:hypothetical protein